MEDKHLIMLDLIIIGYQYNNKVTLYSVIIKNRRLIKKENLYEIKFIESYSNMLIRLANHLVVISNFFKVSNYIDTYNMA